MDAGRPELKRCLEYLREGDTLLVTKIDRLARSTSDLYRIVSALAEKGAAFKVTDDPSIDTMSRTGKLVMGIIALIAEFEIDIRRERQMDGIAKAIERGVKFVRKRELTDERVKEIKTLREAGETVPANMQRIYLERAFQAAWEHIEQQEPDRERRNDSARQDALRRSVLRIAGCNFSYSRAA